MTAAYALTVEKFLEHAAKWHAEAQIVSVVPDGSVTRVSYAQLRERCNLVSGGLLTRGLRVGDRMATLAWNSVDHVAMYYAAMAAGLVCHTLNPRLGVSPLAGMMNEASDRWIAVGAGLQEMLRALLPLCPGVEGVILLDGEQPEEWLAAGGCPHWTMDEFLRRFGCAAAWGHLTEDAAAGLCYTSGTTGPPRGVVYTHRTNYLHTLRILQADAMAFTARDVVLVTVPLFHANGWGLPFAAPAVGAKMVLPGRSLDPAHLRELIVREAVTVAAAVPTVWLGLLELVERDEGELPSLERIVIGGSPCGDALLARIEARLRVKVQTSWGMTELAPLGTIEALDSVPVAGPRSSGRVPLGLDLKLVDAEGLPLQAQRNVVGRLRVKGATVAERYYGDGTTALDTEGYFDTGDLAVIDDAGYVTIAGRSKDLIKSGGEWINPREIERVIAGLPDVALVAVVGRADLKWGERPVLAVEPCKGCAIDEQMLLRALRGKVPDWWIPDEVHIVERMPVAATGKIDKKRLREETFGETRG